MIKVNNKLAKVFEFDCKENNSTSDCFLIFKCGDNVLLRILVKLLVESITNDDDDIV